jgi:hypothetical protein
MLWNRWSLPWSPELAEEVIRWRAAEGDLPAVAATGIATARASAPIPRIRSF